MYNQVYDHLSFFSLQVVDFILLGTWATVKFIVLGFQACRCFNVYVKINKSWKRFNFFSSSYKIYEKFSLLTLCVRNTFKLNYQNSWSRIQTLINSTCLHTNQTPMWYSFCKLRFYSMHTVHNYFISLASKWNSSFKTKEAERMKLTTFSCRKTCMKTWKSFHVPVVKIIL